MQDDLRLAYAAVWGGFAVVRGAYAVKVYAQRRGAHRAPENPWRLGAIVALGLVGFAGSLAYLAAPALSASWDFPLPMPLRWAGLPLGLVALALFTWSHHALGAHWSLRLFVKEGDDLVTTGPYRWVRHPMYTSLLLGGLAVTLLSANAPAGLAWLLLAVLVCARAGEEEAALGQAFGTSYRGYLAATGRFLPRRSPPKPDS